MSLKVTDKDLSAFTIWHRDSSGKPDETYQSSSGMAGPVVECINIARHFLAHSKVIHGFDQLGGKYSEEHPNAWYLDTPNAVANTAHMGRVFIRKILKTFPLVFVDDTLRDPGCGAQHERRPWDGTDFDPLDQSIQINGQVSGVGST